MYVYIAIFSFSFLLSAPSLSYSYDFKWASGTELNEEMINAVPIEYGFFENLLGISGYFYKDWFFSTEFEYSDPPAFGFSCTDFRSMTNNFFIERNTGRLYMKFGTLSTLLGQGLSVNMYQDQTLDFDNTVNGFEGYFNVNDNLKVISSIGLGEYQYRSNAANRKADLSADLSFFSTGAEYFHDNSGTSAQYYFTRSVAGIGPESIYLYKGVRETLGLELNNRLSDLEHPVLGSAFGLCIGEPGSGTILDCTISDSIVSYAHDIIFDTSIGNLGLFINGQWDRYEKIYGDFTNGYNLYLALYTDIFDWGVTADFKSYYSPYKLQTISSKPTVFRDQNSTLLSRASHHFNFNNEHGFQIDLTRYLENGLFLNMNYAFSRRYAIDTFDPDNDNSPITKGSSEIFDSANYPFMQFFTEVSGYMFDDRFYFKLAYDNFYEDKYNKGLIQKNTFPSNFSWVFNQNISAVVYNEIQFTTRDYGDDGSQDLFNNHLAGSLSYKGKFIITVMNEYEKLSYRDESSSWPGIQLTIYPKDNIQMEIFYGSIKGGLVCANGICAVQPGFSNGLKVLVRTSF